jgi:hypothetical protein
MKLKKNKLGLYVIVQSDGVDRVHLTIKELMELKQNIESILETESQEVMLDSFIPYEL